MALIQLYCNYRRCCLFLLDFRIIYILYIIEGGLGIRDTSLCNSGESQVIKRIIKTLFYRKQVCSMTDVDDIYPDLLPVLCLLLSIRLWVAAVKYNKHFSSLEMFSLMQCCKRLTDSLISTVTRSYSDMCLLSDCVQQKPKHNWHFLVYVWIRCLFIF